MVKREDPLDRLFKSTYAKLEKKTQDLSNMAADLQRAFQAYFPGETIPEDTLPILIWHIIKYEPEAQQAIYSCDKFKYFEEMKNYEGPASVKITARALKILREKVIK